MPKIKRDFLTRHQSKAKFEDVEIEKWSGAKVGPSLAIVRERFEHAEGDGENVWRVLSRK